MKAKKTKPAVPQYPLWRCDCGLLAEFKLPILLYGADFIESHRTHLKICPGCYKLEVCACFDSGRRIPFVQPLPVLLSGYEKAVAQPFKGS